MLVFRGLGKYERPLPEADQHSDLLRCGPASSHTLFYQCVCVVNWLGRYARTEEAGPDDVFTRILVRPSRNGQPETAYQPTNTGNWDQLNDQRSAVWVFAVFGHGCGHCSRRFYA